MPHTVLGAGEKEENIANKYLILLRGRWYNLVLIETQRPAVVLPIHMHTQILCGFKFSFLEVCAKKWNSGLHDTPYLTVQNSQTVSKVTASFYIPTSII